MLRDKIDFLKLHLNRLLSRHRKRIYQLHIQKTGGSTVNHAFADLAYEKEKIAKIESMGKLKGLDFSSELYRGLTNAQRVVRIANRTEGRSFEGNGFKYCAWNTELFTNGDFDYGFSHIPLDQLALPEDTFIFAIFRDPLARLVSRYKNMLQLLEVEDGYKHYNFEYLEKPVREGFFSWIEACPRGEVQSHLHLLDSTLNVERAISRLNRIDSIHFTETLDETLPVMMKQLALSYNKPKRAKESSVSFELSDKEKSRAREFIRDDILVYEAAIRCSQIER